MDLTSIPFFDILRERMGWLSARQNVLSQNVANVDTPSYMARDLKPLDFEKLLRESGHSSTAPVSLAVTDPHHIATAPGASSGYAEDPTGDQAIDQTGNSVDAEEEMMKVADTQVQYQAAADLYAKAIGMMRTAIDKSGP